MYSLKAPFSYGHVYLPQQQLLRTPGDNAGSIDPHHERRLSSISNNNYNQQSSSTKLKRVSSESSLAEINYYEGYLYKRSKANPQKWLKRFFRWDGETLGYHTNPNDPAEAQWRVRVKDIVSVSLNTIEQSISSPITKTSISKYVCEVKFLDGSDIEVASKNVNETRKWCDILNKSLDVEWLRSFRDALVPGLRGNRDAHIIMLTDDNDDEPDALETQLDTGASVSVELPEHVRSSSNSSASAARSGHHKNIESSDFYKNSWPSPVDDESSHQFPMKYNNPTALTTQQQTSLENDARKLDHKQDKASSISANMISKPPSIPNTMPVAKYLPTPPKRAPAPVKKSVSQSSLYLIDNLAQDLFMAIPEAPMPNTVFATNPKPNILPKPTSIANGDNQITSPGSARAGGAQGGKPNKISIPQRRSQAEVIQEFLRSKSEPNFSDFITASNHQQQNSPYIASRGSLYSQHSEFAEVKFDKDKQHQRYSTGALSQDTVDKLNDLMLDIVSGMLATPITTAEVNASKMRFSETNRPDHRRNSSRGGGGAVLTKNANSLIILDPVPPTQAATDAASLIQKGLDDIANVPTLVRKNTFGKKQAQEMKNNSSIIGNNTNMKDSSDSLNKDQQESQPQPPISNEMKKTKSQTFGTELAREMSLKIHTILNNGQEQHQESSQTAVKSQQQPQQTAAPKSAGGPNSGTYTTVKSSNLVSEHIDYLWKLCDYGIQTLEESVHAGGGGKKKVENLQKILATITSVCLRCISVHIMLSDASKWEQQESDGKLQKNRQSGISTLPVVISFRPISTYKQSSAVKQRSLAELKNGIRELCSNAYNLSTFSSSSDSARQMLRILEGITGWNVIRREAAIASSIKHQMAVLDNLQAFDWGSTTQTSSTASSPSKLRIHLPFHPKDLLESIEVLKMRLAQINEVFGDHCDVLPNWQ